jgi:DNA-binding winged helix-turn-helix (wHTH) protein
MLWQFEDCTLNTQTRMLWKQGSLLRLQPKVMDLLIVLIQNHSRYVSKNELFEMLWTGVRVGNASLLRLVRELRRALNDDGRNPRLIRTLHSRGYQFVGSVTHLTELTEACV